MTIRDDLLEQLDTFSVGETLEGTLQNVKKAVPQPLLSKGTLLKERNVLGTDLQRVPVVGEES